MFKNRKILGRRSTWGLTACFVQTQQMKALTGEPLRSSRNVKEQENSGEAQDLGRRSFLGGLRNWGPAHLTCKLSICWGGTDPGTHDHRGAAVPPRGLGNSKFQSNMQLKNRLIPPHHTLPDFLNLHGSKRNMKIFARRDLLKNVYGRKKYSAESLAFKRYQ